MVMQKTALSSLSRIGVMGVFSTLIACGGSTTTPDRVVVDDTTETQREVEREPELTPEQIEAQRQAAAEGAFAEAAAIYAQGRAGERNYARILSLLEEVLETQPTLADAWFNIGLVKHEQGDIEGAIAAYQRAGEVDRTYARGLANIGYIRLEQGDIAGAQRIFEECIQRREIEPGCNINLGMLYMSGDVPTPGGQDRTDSAILRLRFALGGDARSAVAYANVARIYHGLGRLDLARLVCEDAILRGIDSAVLHNRLGLIALDQNDVLRAFQEFQRAVQVDPDYWDAYMNIGAMALNFRDYDTAVYAFELVLEQFQDNLDVRLSYGAALRGLDQLTDAEEQYRMVLNRDSQNLGAFYNLAILYQEGYADYATACGYYKNFLAQPAAMSSDRYDEVTQRLYNLFVLVETLLDFGEGDPATVEACRH